MNDRSHVNTAFLGKVTASVSHDLQNVFAVIRESSGLMEDILAMSQNSEKTDILEKVSTYISSVVKQIDRGVAITSNLNGFAHTADFQTDYLAVGESLERLLFLTKKILLHKGIEVGVENVNQSYSVQTDPVGLQVLLYDCIEFAGQHSLGGEVQVVAGRDSVAAIHTARNADCAADPENKQTAWSKVLEDAGKIDARVTLMDNDQGLCLVLE